MPWGDCCINHAWPKFVLNIEEISSFEFPLDKQFELEVNYKNVKYEFLVKLSSSESGLICFGPSAYDPNEYSPPIYLRNTWHDDFKASTICYNDPTTYNYTDFDNFERPDLITGWGVGKLDDYYLKNIGIIISSLAHRQNISNEDIIFFGSSAGGFCSIMLATILKTPIVIVNNPRIIIDTNSGPFKDLVNSCFEGSYEDALKYNYRFDIIQMFEKENYMPHIIYFINVNSEEDLNNGCIPFIESLVSINNFKDSNMQIIAYSDDNRHVGFYPKEEIISIIQDILNSNDKYTKISQLQYLKKNINNDLRLKKEQIAELQTFKGYFKYKTKNIYQRTKNKFKK